MATRRKKEFGGGSPLVYFLALAAVALTVGPVLYGALGGFRSNEQLARDPAGLPDPWVWKNYSGVISNPVKWMTLPFLSSAMPLTLSISASAKAGVASSSAAIAASATVTPDLFRGPPRHEKRRRGSRRTVDAETSPA